MEGEDKNSSRHFFASSTVCGKTSYIVRPGWDGDCEIVCTEFVKCVNKLPHRRFVTETHIDFPLEISGS